MAKEKLFVWTRGIGAWQGEVVCREPRRERLSWCRGVSPWQKEAVCGDR